MSSIDPLIFKTSLPLVPYVPRRSLSLKELLHLVYTLSTWLTLVMPRIVVTRHLVPLLTLYRYRHPKMKETGLRLLPDLMYDFVGHCLLRLTPVTARSFLFGRSFPYKLGHADPIFNPYRHWLEDVRKEGVTGRWIADPARDRRDDDIVIYYIHGGGFQNDTAGLAQKFWMILIKELKQQFGRDVSLFSLDYELAPEYVWPSQIVETLTGYSYLVHQLGIRPARVCIAGDSAGGPIIHSTLLHLARPSPDISLPPQYRIDELRKPGGALLIAPFLRLVSDSATILKYDHVDVINSSAIQSATLDYIGSTPWSYREPSFDPRHIFKAPSNAYELFDPPRSRETWSSTEQAIGRRIQDPYVNPCKVSDGEWWKEALPEEGGFCVCWGEKEVLAGDIERIIERIEEAGVPVTKICKTYALHDWLIYEWTVPFLNQTHSQGPDRQKRWGIERTAAFLDSVAVRADKAS